MSHVLIAWHKSIFNNSSLSHEAGTGRSKIVWINIPVHPFTSFHSIVKIIGLCLIQNELSIVVFTMLESK